MQYLKKIEWEYLQNEIDLSMIYKTWKGLDLKSVKSMILKRDENFEIILIIIANIFEKNIEKIKFHEINNISLENDEEILNLNYCSLINRTTSVGKESYYELKFKVKNVEKTKKTGEDVYYIKEWYLNSTSNKLIFRRGTEYNINKKYTKIRNIPKNKEVKIEQNVPKFSSLDSFFIELNDFNLIIQSVPDIYGPNWSNNLSFEYQKDYHIPSEKNREKITEIFSFLLGRYLIKIGETHYDRNWNIIKQYSFIPTFSTKINIKDIKKNPSKPSIDFREIIPEFFDIESEISKIIDSYLSEDTIDLSYIINQLLLSTLYPTEAEIVIIGGCLDELSKNWIESEKSASKGLILEAKLYNKLIKKELKVIKEKLKDYPEAYKKIENGYKFSGGKKNDVFLEELGLETGKSEEKARSYRNIPAHGHKISDKTRLKMVYLTDIYRTLLNRIILKILNYPYYFDLTTGQNIKINEKLPEKDFYKNIKEIEEFYKENY